MTKQKINIWGREFELDVIYDCYEGESVLPCQTEAFHNLINNSDVINKTLDVVKDYCLKLNSADIENSKIENIFKYVVPKAFYIQRTKDVSRVVALMCAYKFDVNNGLAVVFKNEAFYKIGTQNIIL